MAGSVNKVILVGRVGRDPEIRQTREGGKIANLTVATSEVWTDRSSGERKERTEWTKVAIMNEKLSDLVERFVKKGSLVAVEGSLATRKWTDQQGSERYSTEVVVGKFNGSVVFLDSNGDGGQRSSSQGSSARPNGGPRGKSPADDLNDEIPF